MKQRKKDRQTERKILFLKHLSIEIPKKHFFPLVIQIFKSTLRNKLYHISEILHIQ
jgi:hypothetical protein